MIVGGETVARFVSDGIGFGLCPPYAAIGVSQHDQITGGVLLNCFEGADVNATAYGSGWSREFLQALGDFVYSHLGCERMTLTTEQPEVVKLACKLGGVVEGCLRSHFGKGRDGIIIGILKDEYRYLRGESRHGRKSPSKAPLD